MGTSGRKGRKGMKISRTALVVAALLFVGAVASEATVWDMERFFPGELARTHDLVAADGQKLAYSFPGGGAFGRVVDARGTDWQFWIDAGMVYLGWFWQDPGGPLEAYWSTPPNLSIPRFFDDTSSWATRYSDVLVHVRYTGAEWEFISAIPETVDIEITPSLLGGEWTLLATGKMSTGYEERWWLAPCIPVRGGENEACSPGVRRIQMFDAEGKITFERRFEEWVPK